MTKLLSPTTNLKTMGSPKCINKNAHARFLNKQMKELNAGIYIFLRLSHWTCGQIACVVC